MKRLFFLPALVLLGCEQSHPSIVSSPPGQVQPPAVVSPPGNVQPPPVNKAASPPTLDASSEEALRQSWLELMSGSEEEKRQVNFGIQLLAHRGMRESRFEGMSNIPLWRSLEFAHGMTREQILEATVAERAAMQPATRP